MSELSESKIVAEIQKTGFPLELRVAALLERREFRVAHSLYYVDADENKGREIDLRALKNVRSRPSDPQWIRYLLMVECKKLDRPWVVLCSPVNNYDMGLNQVDVIGLKLNKKHVPPRLPFESAEIDHIAALHPYFSPHLRGRSYFEAFKGEDSTGRIFGAVATAVKATIAMRRAKFAANVCFYYPLVVVDGRLFQGTLKEDEVEVSEIQSTVISFFYASREYGDEKFIVPVVRFEALEAFLDQMDAAHDSIATLMEDRDLETKSDTAR